MPALSPTMESGVLAEWNLGVGSSFSAGEAIAEIQTDKATMSFEAQDDGFVAKLLVEPGTECKVGDPIMVTVEDEDQVAAFKDFKAPLKVESVLPPTAAAAPAEPPKPATPPPSPPKQAHVSAPPLAVEAPKASPPPPQPKVPQVAVAPSSKPSTLAPAWGVFAREASPLAKTLAASQREYIQLYGSTGQQPL